uniref:Peroxisomal membrane protein PEX16 n=1 Tax=Strigamia maritima TaxID=126957 RepID=T1IXV4_STRMM
MYKYNYSVVTKKSFPDSLDRKSVAEYLKTCPPSKNMTKSSVILEEDENKAKTPFINGVNKSSSFTLKSTGRVIRTLAAGENKPPLATFQIDASCPQKLVGEMIYTLRPLVHLFLMSVFGRQSWMPWLSSLSMDVCSIYVAGQSQSIRPAEMKELNHRTLELFVYLFRSPFYNKYSKQKLLNIIGALNRVLPLGKPIWTSIESYAELWEQIYFYSWDS